MAISNETREDFMQSMYDMFSDDGSNDRANQIIDIFDIATENCVELPCKVGDTVYQMVYCYDRKTYPATKYPNHYVEKKVVGIHICDSRLRVNALSNMKYRDYLIVGVNNALQHIPFAKIGKTVFLTREEAERVLNSSEKPNSRKEKTNG